MNEDLLRKTIVQLNFSYGVNRRAENPLQYHIANLSGATKTVRVRIINFIFPLF